MNLEKLLFLLAGFAILAFFPVFIFGGERIRRVARLVLRLSIYLGDYNPLYVIFFGSLASILFTLKEVQEMGLDSWMVCGAITSLTFSAIYLYFQSCKSYSKIKAAAEKLKSSLETGNSDQIKESSINLLSVLEEKLLTKEKNDKSSDNMKESVVRGG